MRQKAIAINYSAALLNSTNTVTLRRWGLFKGFKLMDAEVGIGLKLVCHGVKNRISYSHQITTDPLTADSAWTTISTTSKEHAFANLATGTKFWARIIAVGTKDQVSYSEPLSRITQLNIN